MRDFFRPVGAIVAWHLIAIHFFLILLVVTTVWERLPDHTLTRVLLVVSDYYADLTFHNRDFGFFAPAVYADWNLHLVGATATGETREVPLPTDRRELVLKYYSMVGRSADEDARPEFARVWAEWAMRQHPDLASVEVTIRRNVIPSMEEFREGARVHEADEPEYRAVIPRNPPTEAGDAGSTP